MPFSNPSIICFIVLLPLLLQPAMLAPLEDVQIDVEDVSVNTTLAKTLLPPEPTDQAPVSTAYFNQKTYSIKEFHELVDGLNADIRNGFKKIEEESGRLTDAISRLDGRMDKLEGWMDWKWLQRASLSNWPCLLLTGMAVLLLAIALLVLCNTLLIKRVLGGAAAAASNAAAANSSARREKISSKKEREMIGLVQQKEGV